MLASQAPTAGCASQERFAAFVAHELRTPLATQRSLLELALADENTDVAAWREIGGDVLHACREQELLLDACLALARCHAGTRQDVVDLSRIAASTVRAHDLRGLSVKLRLGRAITMGDPVLLERLLVTLLSNAIQHNRPGGWIEVATSNADAQALVMIENTGPAVAPAQVTGLLEPFRRLGSQREDPVGGLGLAVVHAVADAHGAAIRALPRTRGGLRVDVRFPATPQRRPPT